MENISANSFIQPFSSPARPATQAEQPAQTNPVAQPQPAEQVRPTTDLPATNQVQSGAALQNETRTADANTVDPAVQQQQIETFLAERTGEDPSAFQGIDIQSALELQETLRDRPAANENNSFAQAPTTSQQPVEDANAQQEQQQQQELQSRLAQQIPTDPGTEFPPLVDLFA